jgi:hypothetical protein
MAKDMPNGSGTKGSDEAESVKRKKDLKLEKKSKKMKLEVRNHVTVSLVNIRQLFYGRISKR